MKYLTVVYSLPDGFDVATLTQHEFASAFAWSHKMDECNGLTTALEKANASAEKFEREWYLRGDALEDWQTFAADVTPGCAAGADWLDGLRARTAELLTPNAELCGSPERSAGESERAPG